jgi:hypothetical protein
LLKVGVVVKVGEVEVVIKVVKVGVVLKVGEVE